MRLILLLLCCPLVLWTQIPDTIPLDTTILGKTTVVVENQDSTVDSLAQIIADSTVKDSVFFVKRWAKKFVGDYPNPNKALLMGLIIPGGGQMYNGALWKLPLVYGAYGTSIFFINTNNRNYVYYRDQYKLAVNDPELGRQDELQLIFQDPSQIRTIRDEYQRRRDYSWVALVGVTLISVADAFVDCHLKEFDISDDLSWDVRPVITNTPGWGQTAGIGVGIPIR